VPTSILSGGQYDNLMRKMGKQSGAIGFAVYLDLLDRLYAEGESYDADVVVVYESDAEAAAVCREVNRLTEEGNRVAVRRTAPAKMRYKQLITVKNGEVSVVENNA
ncbi:MAG: ATP phosphoribosyltransferase regulatory subunit, partial [Clostridia bacterium]|nr:ATP phosphoribosyltransferase regulatory subunit [Clostridia bacterium]